MGERTQPRLSAVIAFCLGGCIYFSLPFLSLLVPPWLSGFGLDPIDHLQAACLCAFLGRRQINNYIYLAGPNFLQELVLGVWSIVKGFSPAAVAALSTRQPQLED